MKSIGWLNEKLILAGAVRIRLGVQEAAQFTSVHLIHQFTKLGALPLTKSRGFPAPYYEVGARVPGILLHRLRFEDTHSAEGA